MISKLLCYECDAVKYGTGSILRNVDMIIRQDIAIVF